MPDISEIMSTDVQTIKPQDSLRQAARWMADLDIGSLPVCDGKRLLGVVTDRDITIRGVALGLGPDSGSVADVMSDDVQFCTIDQDSEEVLLLMGKTQLRRLPVINLDKELVGIISIGDLATRQSGDVDTAMREISEPTPPQT